MDKNLLITLSNDFLGTFHILFSDEVVTINMGLSAIICDNKVVKNDMEFDHLFNSLSIITIKEFIFSFVISEF